jgi:hypothetical protein
MKTLFLSFSFNDQDRDLVAGVERLLASHEIRPITGRRVGGEAVTPAVLRRVEECDGCVALLTRRDELAAGGWTTHPWVDDELKHARGRDLPAIALVEDGVKPAGAYAEHERIPLDREAPLDAFLALSETIGLWRRQRAGRMLKVQLQPEELARTVSQRANGHRCRYRLTENGEFTEWREARPVREVGGVFLYVPGVRDEHLIEIEVANGVVWSSPATGQWLQVELEREGLR